MQTLSIIGLSFVIIGTIITAYVNMKYTTNADEKREDLLKLTNQNKNLGNEIDLTTKKNEVLNLNLEKLSIENQKLANETKVLSKENKTLNLEIRRLSHRISDQSLLIEKQITGGNSFPYSTFKWFGEKDNKKFILQLKNDFDFPVSNLQLKWFDVDLINNNCVVKKGPNKYFLKNSCYDKSQKVLDVGDVSSNSSINVSAITLVQNSISNKYLIEYHAKNGRYLQKILVYKSDTNEIGFAWILTLNGAIIKKSTDGGIPLNFIDFKTGFEFIDQEYLILDE